MGGFFGAVWKFNAIVIAIGATLMLFASGSIVFGLFAPPMKRGGSVPVETMGDFPFDVAADADAKAMKTGPLLHIEGTTFFSAEISDGARDKAKSEIGTRSRGALDNTRNILVYDAASRAAWRLFPDSSPLILKSTELYRQNAGAEDFVGLYLEYIDEDRNADGRISLEDGLEIAVFDPDLRKAVTPEKIFRVGPEPAIIGDKIVVVSEDENVLTAIHIDLATRHAETVEFPAPQPGK